MKKRGIAILMAGLMLLCGCAADSQTEGETAENQADLQSETASEPQEAAKETDEEPTEQTELTVFAAASMTETLTEIAELYAQVDDSVTLIFNFDSSGTLKTQIEEGAVCDVFISAGQLQMDQLDIAADSASNVDALDYVDSESRIDLLENKVALVVADHAEQEVTGFDDLIEGLQAGSLLLGMGNSDVPVGQYTSKILAYYGLDEETLASSGVITYGTNVKEVTTQVAEGTVDCGVIYSTDAYSAGLEVIDTAEKEMCGQVIYPAAVLKDSTHSAQAQAFLDYLTTDEAMAVFEAVGFSPAAN